MNRIFKNPLALAIILLAIGPMLLGISYIYVVASNNPLSNYRGYFSYYSATVGDAIFLTIAVYFMYAYIEHLRGVFQHRVLIDKIQFVATGVLSIAVTIYTHWLWCSDSLTENNWTFVGAFNIYGYWHAFYFFAMLWCLLFGLLKIITSVNFNSLEKVWVGDVYSHHFEYIFTIMQALLVYAALLAIDNTEGGLPKIVSNGLFLLILAVFLYYIFLYITYIFGGVDRTGVGELLSRSAFAVITTALLIYSVIALTQTITALKGSIVQSFFCYLYIPMLCFQNYIYNLFRNHERNISPMFVMAGVAIYLVIASSCANALMMSGSSSYARIIEKVYIGVAYLTFGWVAALLYGLLVTKNYADTEDLTPESGYFNFFQNYAAFFVMAIFMLLFNISFSNKKEIIELSGYIANIQSFGDLVKFAITGLWTLIILVVGFNFQHLVSIVPNDKKLESVKRIVSLHIWILMIGYSVYGLLITVWGYSEIIFR